MTFFPETGFSYLSNDALMKISYVNKEFNQRAIRTLFSRSSKEAVFYQAQLIAKIIRHNTPKKLINPPREWINNPTLDISDRINGIYFLAAQSSIQLERNEIDFEELDHYEHIKIAIAGLPQSKIQSIQDQAFLRNKKYLKLSLLAGNDLSKLSDAQKSIIYEHLMEELGSPSSLALEYYDVLLKLSAEPETKTIRDVYYNSHHLNLEKQSLLRYVPRLQLLLPYIEPERAKKTLDKIKSMLPKMTFRIDELSEISKLWTQLHIICQLNFSEFIVNFFKKNKRLVDDKLTDSITDSLEVQDVLLLLWNFDTPVDIDVEYFLDRFDKDPVTFRMALYCIGSFLPKFNSQEINITYNKIFAYLTEHVNMISNSDFLYILKKFIPYFMPEQNQSLFKNHIELCVVDSFNYKRVTEILCLLEPYLDTSEREKVFKMVSDIPTSFDAEVHLAYLKALTALVPYLTESQVNTLMENKLIVIDNSTQIATWRYRGGYSLEVEAMNLISLLITRNKYDITHVELLDIYPIKLLKEMNEWVKKIDEPIYNHGPRSNF
ncbi:MAG: hypothetical protein QM652_03630 [Legionella sp.]|uniref:hypothetical protein n=1 Tax=Legionella sp. TaxID=459 RepID=UPI0039E4644E